MSSSPRWPPSRHVNAAIAAGLAIVGLVMLSMAETRSSIPEPVLAAAPHEISVPATSPSAQPTLDRPRSRPGERTVKDQITGLVLPESNPVSVSIPSLGVRSRLLQLGLDRDGAMEVPGDPSLAGWFTRGAAPGALGPAVIAGHVTWNGTPGVFYRLGRMRLGDRVEVARKDGRTAIFTVTRVARFSKSEFPRRAVYGPIDHAGLRLITCGGTYDAVRHTYLDNVVVFARLDAVRGP